MAIVSFIVGVLHIFLFLSCPLLPLEIFLISSSSSTMPSLQCDATCARFVDTRGGSRFSFCDESFFCQKYDLDET